MAKTYQAKHFTGQQLDDFMESVLGGQFAGRGLEIDGQGIMHVSSPAYGNLIYSYVHQANKEVHPEGVNLTTGQWTAKGHGLTQNQQVFVAIHPPYHIIKSYDQLPGGLLLGPANGGGLNAQKYYVNVVDADTFTLSETSGGAVKTYTEVATMDLSRFHFEVFVQQPITIDNLPDLTELLVVIKGRVSNGYRYIRTDGRASLSGKIPVVQYDHAYVDSYGSMYIGNGGGWGSLYATVEMQFVEDKHLMLTFNVDTVCHKTDGMPIARHERAYVHYYMTVDAIKAVYLQQGQFMNGTTVEVYTK